MARIECKLKALLEHLFGVCRVTAADLELKQRVLGFAAVTLAAFT